MNERAQGIVIRTAEYKEKDRILSVFTPYGIRTVTARGVRSEKAKLKSAANVLAFGEFTFGGKPGALVLGGAEIKETFYPAWSDLEKMAAIAVCFELTERCFSTEDDTRAEFVFLLKTLKEIVYGQTEPVALTLAYMLFCARSMGVEYAEIGEYDADAYAMIETFAAATPEEVETLPFDETGVRHALSLVHNVFKNKLDVRLPALKRLLR